MRMGQLGAKRTLLANLFLKSDSDPIRQWDTDSALDKDTIAGVAVVVDLLNSKLFGICLIKRIARCRTEMN